MDQVQAFRSTDGALFATADEARNHETAQQWRARLDVFAKHPLCPYPSGAQRGMLNKVVVAWERYKSEAA